jgi:hypothetical protein
VTDLAALPCSERAEALGEPLAGTAPAERGVLVLEQSGPWGRDALWESGLRPRAAELEAHAKAAGLRIQIVRKATRRYAAEHLSAWVAGFVPGARFLERFELDDPRALLDVPLSAESPSGAGVVDDGLLLLSCTHSTRDPCCARRGLPLHRALTATGERTWHASHLGGHRFAATMAALPLGVWLGRIPAEQAGDVVALLRERRIPLRYLRGVAGMPPAAQAADAAIRQATGLDGIDDVRRTGELTFETAGGGAFAAEVRHVPTGVVRAVSCGPDAKREDPGRYEVDLVPTRPPSETGRRKL